MHKACMLGCLALLLAQYAGAVSGDGLLPLKDNWQIQSSAKIADAGASISSADFGAQGWYAVSVPRTVLAALVDNGVYPDPYYGLNMKAIPGFQEGRMLLMPQDSPFRPAWWYRTTFQVSAECKGKVLTLHLDGINYQANVWLNGKQLADKETIKGMFRRFELPITDAVKTGEVNCLAIEVIPPGLLTGERPRTKQIEATTGWDDHNPCPPDLNLGIWQDVYIKASGPVRVRHPYVATDLDLPSLDTAHLTVSAEVANVSHKKTTAEVSGRIENISFSQTVSLKPGETQSVVFTPKQFRQLNLSKPRLWWPHPVGPQELYDLHLQVSVEGEISDTNHVRFGIREATSYINDEGWRAFKINGKNILIRGGAWMTSDILLRFTHKRYDALVRYAREANLNMLRSEGFSIRETDDFFDLCDQYGVMVTQQIFGRSIPDEQLAIDCTKDTILRIRNHPSLVHFLGHDETFPTETLDQAYRDLIAKYTPERTYQPHSGAFDVKDRFRTGGTRTGTRELWTYATPAHYYTHKEDGAWGFAQSGGIGGVCACIESVKRMMPAEALWPLWTEAWSFHTVIQGGRYFDALLKALDARYGKPSGIEEFCMKARALNYESARGMFEAYARNKYSATGITTWKYDAAWPAAMTWQYIDWYLLPTGAYYGAKKACKPLHVQYSYDDHSIYVVNSLYRPFKDLKVSAKVYDFDMTERYAKTAELSVEPDGKTMAFIIEWPKNLTKSHFLSLKMHDSAGSLISDNLYWLSTVPDVPGTKSEQRDLFTVNPVSVADHTDLNKLAPVTLKAVHSFEQKGRETLASVTVENSTKHLAFCIQLAVTKGEGGAEVAPSFWADNDFSLLPGEQKTVTATFYTEDLEGTTPALRITGWNIKS